MAIKQQIPVLAARLVEFQEEFSNLSTDDTQWAIMNTKKAIVIFIEAVKNRVKEIAACGSDILGDCIYTRGRAPVKSEFVVKDKFIINTSRKAKVKISGLSENFISWFKDKSETTFHGGYIYVRDLKGSAVNVEIIAEFGNGNAFEVTLSDIYTLMQSQANGEDGILVNNKCANIFYARDEIGLLRVVIVDWRINGWSLHAFSIDDPGKLMAGRVFSRKLCLVLR